MSVDAFFEWNEGEDLQHGQRIDALTIENPFLE